MASIGRPHRGDSGNQEPVRNFQVEPGLSVAFVDPRLRPAGFGAVTRLDRQVQHGAGHLGPQRALAQGLKAAAQREDGLVGPCLPDGGGHRLGMARQGGQQACGAQEGK